MLNANATLPYFIKRLLPEIKAVVKTHDPADLATAFDKAKAYEQGKSESTSRKHRKTKKYESSSDESSDSSEEEKHYKKKKKEKELKKKKEKKSSTQKCYTCEEQGHFARDCLSEKVPYNRSRNKRNVSYVEQADSENEEEYEILETVRNKVNTRTTSIRKPGKSPKQSAPKTVFPKTPHPKVKIQEPKIVVNFEKNPYDKEDSDIEMKETPAKVTKPSTAFAKPKVPKTKRLPSVIDQLTLYDISEDILKMASSTKIGQLLKYPDQKRNLIKILRRPTPVYTIWDFDIWILNLGGRYTPASANLLETGIEKRTIAAKCYVRIKKNPIVAVLDSGTAVSIITNKLRQLLKLEITRPSKCDTRQRALEIIESVGISVQDLLVPMQLQKESEIENNDEIQQEIEYELEDEDDLEELESYHSEQVNDTDNNISSQQDDKLPSEVTDTSEENPATFIAAYEIQLNENPDELIVHKGILDEQQTIVTDKLFSENTDVFAENISEKRQTIELTQTHIVEHEIKTHDAEPIKQ
ncbi:hypothetical protein Glove_120g231 [Diversispora epigaea]|uniref:CCHC-type domain-containing protein n=1 Tax=Diversispora epigaea TaxID=1348612 RepID=A0A397J9N7_9GLOM|nr:hypothetical protein Glove_120g231 [Diversispora epigaea]